MTSALVPIQPTKRDPAFSHAHDKRYLNPRSSCSAFPSPPPIAYLPATTPFLSSHQSLYERPYRALTPLHPHDEDFYRHPSPWCYYLGRSSNCSSRVYAAKLRCTQLPQRTDRVISTDIFEANMYHQHVGCRTNCLWLCPRRLCLLLSACEFRLRCPGLCQSGLRHK